MKQYLTIELRHTPSKGYKGYKTLHHHFLRGLAGILEQFGEMWKVLPSFIEIRILSEIEGSRMFLVKYGLDSKKILSLYTFIHLNKLLLLIDD